MAENLITCHPTEILFDGEPQPRNPWDKSDQRCDAEMAATQHCPRAINPCVPGSAAHAEWDAGYVALLRRIS